MRRRTFLIVCAGAASVCLVGCGGDDGHAVGDADAGSASFSVENQDQTDHRHTVTILCSDLGAGRPVSYVATGPHEHTIELSRDQLALLAAGETVTISFTDGHSHTFVIAVPPATC